MQWTVTLRQVTIFSNLFCFSDVNECVEDKATQCHVHALCTNNDGSYTCACSDGYFGNGINCRGNILFVLNRFNTFN